MGFSLVIPGSVVALGQTTAVSVTSYLERRLFWNIDTGTLSSRDDDRVVLERWISKRGDLERIAVRVLNERADGTTEKLRLPEGCAIAFAAVRKLNNKGDFGGTVLAAATLTLDDSKPEDPKYVGIIDWGTVELNDAIDFGEGAELGYLDLVADIEIEQSGQGGGVLARISSANMDIRVVNDVRRSGQAQPTAATLMRGMQFRPEITGLAGGGATNLDGLPTAGMTAGAVMVFIRIGGFVQAWILEEGSAAENPAGGIVWPDDRGAGNKLWVRVL